MVPINKTHKWNINMHVAYMHKHYCNMKNISVDNLLS